MAIYLPLKNGRTLRIPFVFFGLLLFLLFILGMGIAKGCNQLFYPKKNESSCHYHLRAGDSLQYNPVTQTYIIKTRVILRFSNSNTPDNAAIVDTQYWWYGRQDYTFRGLANLGRMSKRDAAIAFTDSCAAKGALQYADSLEADRNRRIWQNDSIQKVQDSINSLYQTIR
jgi:hypothetical protein